MASGQPAPLPFNSGASHRWLQSISIVTVVAVFALVVLGGVVRVTGSGLGCPDWPLCYGKLLPPLEYTAILEYSHRFVASVIVGPLVAATAVTIFWKYRQERWLTIPAAIAVVLLILQALLGGYTVIKELPGAIVAAHLALAQALLGILVLTSVVACKGPLSAGPQDPPDRFPKLALISALGVYVLIISGALVTATGATAACVTWPLCQGDVFPQRFLPAIHMGHRYVALIIGLFVLYSVHLGFRGRQRPRDIRLLSMTVAASFTAQVIVGAFTIWTGFSTHMIAFHMVLGTLVWSAMAATAFVACTRPSPAREPAHD